MRPSYHEMAMTSNHKFQVIRAPRQSGKTRLCMEWIKNTPHDSYILYVTDTQMRSDLIHAAFLQYHGEDVEAFTPRYIKLKGNRMVHLTTGSGYIRGVRATHIVVDEFGVKPKEVMDAISVIKVRCDASVLMVGTRILPESIGEWLEEHQPVISFINYSWLDAAYEGVYSLTDIRSALATLSDDIFSEDFGPWEPLIPQTNEDFLHKLHHD